MALLILIGVGIYFQFQSKPVEPVKGALLVNLSGVIVDQPAINNKLRQWGRELLGASSNRLQENSLFDIVETIRLAKDDDNINGLVLSLSDLTGQINPRCNILVRLYGNFATPARKFMPSATATIKPNTI